jgi:hypothetical protein
MDRERVREALRFFHGLEEQPPVSDELQRRVASELGATREMTGQADTRQVGRQGRRRRHARRVEAG